MPQDQQIDASMAEGYTIAIVRDGDDVLSECAGKQYEAVSRAWWRRQSTRNSKAVMVTLPDGQKLEVKPEWSMQDIGAEIARRQEG